MPWWNWKKWPGWGPFSDLPPWERPGWKYGRGWCWLYWKDYLESNEKKMLEEEKKYLEERIKELEEKLKKLEGKE